MPAPLPVPVAPSLRDRCPSCLGLPSYAPTAWRVVEGQVRCGYACTGCGHVWVTSWAADTLGGAA